MARHQGCRLWRAQVAGLFKKNLSVVRGQKLMALACLVVIPVACMVINVAIMGDEVPVSVHFNDWRLREFADYQDYDLPLYTAAAPMDPLPKCHSDAGECVPIILHADDQDRLDIVADALAASLSAASTEDDGPWVVGEAPDFSADIWKVNSDIWEPGSPGFVTRFGKWAVAMPGQYQYIVNVSRVAPDEDFGCPNGTCGWYQVPHEAQFRFFTFQNSTCSLYYGDNVRASDMPMMDQWGECPGFADLLVKYLYDAGLQVAASLDGARAGAAGRGPYVGDVKFQPMPGWPAEFGPLMAEAYSGGAYDHDAATADVHHRERDEFTYLFLVLGFLTPGLWLAMTMVREKERNLRTTLTMIGVHTSAHYASWALLIVPVYAVYAVVVPLVSAATGVPAYSGNPFLVNHMFAYFVLGCMMVGNVFFLAAALNTARTLVIIKMIYVVATLAFAAIGGLFLNRYPEILQRYTMSHGELMVILLELFASMSVMLYPPALYMRFLLDGDNWSCPGRNEYGLYGDDEPWWANGNTWWSEPTNASWAQTAPPQTTASPTALPECSEVYWTLAACLRFAVFACFAYWGVAWYIDQVRGSSRTQGKRRLFCCARSVWNNCCHHKHEIDLNDNPFAGMQPPPAPGISDRSALKETHRALADQVRRRNEDNAGEEVEGFRGVEADPRVLRVGRMCKTYRSSWICCGRVRVGDIDAVKELSLTAERGEILVLLGPNGAGKTTLMSAITSNVRAEAGIISVAGFTVADNADAVRQRLNVCPQFEALWSELTLEEHLRVTARVRGVPSAEIAGLVAERLADVHLTAIKDKRPGDLSGGMRRRLAVAMAFTGQADLILLDEPTTGLDPVNRRHVWDMIEKMKGESAIVLSTHSMEEADVIGDRVAMCIKGQLATIGSPANLKRRHRVGYRVTVTTDDTEAAAAAVVESLPEVAGVLMPPRKILYSFPREGFGAVAAMFTALKDDGVITDWVIVEPSLDAVFAAIAEDRGLSNVVLANFASYASGGSRQVSAGLVTAPVGGRAATAAVGDGIAVRTQFDDSSSSSVEPPPARSAGARANAIDDTSSGSFDDAQPLTGGGEFTGGLLGAQTERTLKRTCSALLYKEMHQQSRRRKTNGCVVFFLVVGIMTLEIFINISGMNNDPRSMADSEWAWAPDMVERYVGMDIGVPMCSNVLNHEMPLYASYYVPNEGIGDILANITRCPPSTMPVVSDQGEALNDAFLETARTRLEFFDTQGGIDFNGNYLRNPFPVAAFPDFEMADSGPSFTFVTEPIIANSNPVADALYENVFMCTDSQSCWPGSDYNVHQVQGDALSLAYTAYGRSRVHPDFKAFGSIQSSTAYCAEPNYGVFGSFSYDGMCIGSYEDFFHRVVDSDLLSIPVTVIIAVVLMPVFVYSIVVVRENGTQEYLHSMGLSPVTSTAFTFAFQFSYFTAVMAVVYLTGWVTRIHLFFHSSFSIYWASMIFGGVSIVSWSHLVSAPFSNPRKAIFYGLAFSFLLAGVAMGVNFGLYRENYYPNFTNYLPIFPFVRALLLMAMYSDQNEIHLGHTFTHEIGGVFLAMAVQSLAFGALTYYLNNVVARKFGRRRGACFCFNPIVSKLCGGSRPRQTAGVSVRDVDLEMGMVGASASGSDEGARGGGSSAGIGHDGVAGGAAAVEAEARKVATADPNSHAVLLNRLAKTYVSGLSRKEALRGVSLAIETDECFVLLGPNGSGKSTAFSVLSGVYRPTGGAASIMGADLQTQLAAARQHVGVCWQDDMLYDDLSVKEHLKFMSRLKGVPEDRERDHVVNLIAEMGLEYDKNKMATALSGGMRRRLSLACALVGDSKVVILDEPTTGLDVDVRRRVWEAIGRARRGRCILMSTHSLEEADELATRIGILAHGKLKALGTQDELRAQYGEAMVIKVQTKRSGKARAVDRLMAGAVPAAVSVSHSFKTHVYHHARDTIDLPAVFEAMEEAVAGGDIVSFSVAQSSLEETFRRVVAEEAAEATA